MPAAPLFPKLFLALSAFFGASSLFGFLLLPMRSVYVFLGIAPEMVSKNQPVFVTAMLIACLASYLYFKLFDYKGPFETEPKKSTKRQFSKPQFIFQIGISLFLFVRAIVEVQSTPMNIDELSYVTVLARGDYSYGISPHQVGSHTLSALLNLGFIKLFGPSPITGRLSAIVFTALLLLTLNYLCFRYASPFVSFLLFAHLSSNELFAWYAHSSRGYVSLMWVSSCLFGLTLKFTKESHWEKKHSFLWGILVVAGFLAHGLSTLFFTVMLLALLAWLWTNRAGITETKFKTGLQLVLLTTGLLMLQTPITLLHLREISHWMRETFPYMLPLSLSNPLGLTRAWWGKLLFLGVLGLAPFVLMANRKMFSTYFVVALIGFFLALMLPSGTYTIDKRFLVAFVIPFIYWVGEASATLTSSKARTLAMAGFAAVLAIGPNFYRTEIYQTESAGLQGYKAFMERVKREVPKVAGHCFSYSGHPYFILYTENLYLPNRKHGTDVSCQRRYHLTLDWEHKKEGEWEGLKAPNPELFEKVYSDGVRSLHVSRHLPGGAEDRPSQQ